MNNKRTRLYVMIGLAIVILAGAIVLNVILNKPEGDVAETPLPTQTGDAAANAQAGINYFEQYRQEREEQRGLEIEVLNAIIGNQDTDEETMADAQAQLMEIVDCMEKELTIESLLKAKGFADSAVTFHYGSVNVIIDAAELTSEEIAQILDIVRRETGEPAGNIKISPKG
ncbi:MAG: SpoIIIAH-like family protein [Clostridia bacterium]|nr:SpoIIIAH-like family protein [Clostridia bacterium]